MLKKFRKDNTEVEAVKWDGSDESMEDIKSLLGEKADRIQPPDPDAKVFNMIVKKGVCPIYLTNWIVKDSGHFFVVSDNIFHDFFTEIK